MQCIVPVNAAIFESSKRTRSQNSTFKMLLAMKTSFKTIAAAVAFSFVFAFSASANNFAANTNAEDKEGKKTTEFDTGIYASKSGKLHVNVDKYSKEPAIVLVTDQSGKTVYREVVRKDVNKFRTAFDVSHLPSGTYTIEVAGQGHKQSKTFELTEKIAERAISVR
jgi:hypothetical protein